MSNKIIDIKIPNMGDFDSMPVIEILIAEGDILAIDDSLITLESEKASMDIPSPHAGKITEILVAVDEIVQQGTVIARMEVSASSSATEDKGLKTDDRVQKSTTNNYDTELLILGGGPGGYTAAFRAADLGMQATLVERYSTLGGVCLNVGCIPSKALLHSAQVIREADHMQQHGLDFGKVKIDKDKLLNWKDSITKKLTGGLAHMAKQRKVNVVNGTGLFVDDHTMSVDGKNITFKQCIIAAGSQVFKLPNIPWDDKRVMDSTDALEMSDIPKTMLILGGGIIGLEMATVYSALGTEITIVEMMPQIIPGADKDLVRPLMMLSKKRYKDIKLKTKVTNVTAKKNGLEVEFDEKEKITYDKVLVAVGRVPNGNKLDADKAGIQVTDRGFIEVDKQQRTNINHIFAIGDIVGQPMLAHKATHEAKIAAEVAHGEKVFFDALVIPSVAYTDPEVAWVGETELTAKSKGINYGIGKFPWAASGRALGLDRTEGFTKLIFDNDTNLVIGAGITGPNAGELISELSLAIEMGCEAADISLTIHPHPTLAESVAMSAEIFEGTITDLYMPKKK
ncbi:MAG: dihydrolipoyl dehydrogenase [Proteobacteria bacterium]|nr:dihydrolipoyl dehydrogenase [Pseudomonadota bacterium]